MNDRQKTVLVHAINHFGVEENIDKALEEMGELTTELSRRRLPRYDKEKVAEEIADVLITVEKLRIIFGGSRVDSYIEKKLEALEDEMNGDWRRQERMMPPGMVVHREANHVIHGRPTEFDDLTRHQIQVRQDAEVWGSAILVAMLDLDGNRIPCCAKCAKLKKDLSSNGPWCDHHGIICGDLTKICCTDYQRKEDDSDE